MRRAQSDYFAGDLFGELYVAETPPAKRRMAAYAPGLLLCGTASLAAAWLAEHYGFPIILLGLLIGLALSFISEVEATAPGLDFASRHFLRAGIVLLGLQVTFAQIGALGWSAFGGLLLVMASAFAAALLAARWTREGREAGILAGGATAICGASAALALYAVIGRERLDQARFSAALVGVAGASAIAMSLYPALAQMIGLSDTQAGFLIGASVHDVAQAIGGAYSYSDTAGANATVVKLARVAMLAPVIALVALWIGGSGGGKGSAWRRVAMPWFIAGFLALLVVNSLVAVPQGWADGALTLSKALLLLAVTATAMRSHLPLLLEAGWRALAPVAAASLVSFLVALAVAWQMP
jgi:uncharacterized integral membrane protein (TIGR00698 family)